MTTLSIRPETVRFGGALRGGDDATTLFESAPEAQLLLDPYADSVLAANAAARRLLGFAAERMPQLTASRLLGAGLDQLVVFTQAVLEKGEGWTDRLYYRDNQGELLRLECHAVRVMSPQGVAVLASVRDMRRQRGLREYADANEFMNRGLSEWRRVERLFAEIEQENRLILQAAGEGIYGVDTSGATTFVNPAAARMLGYGADELVGRNMHSLLHHTHTDGTHYPVGQCPIYAAFKDGVVHQVEDEVFWRKDGSAFPVEYTSTPIRKSGELVGAVVVFRDISERLETDRRLHRALEELGQLKRRLELENAYLQEQIDEDHNHQEIVGRSGALRQTIYQIEMVAPTDAAVLITGESGTGKELIARAIHQSSRRAERPLIRVNCAAVPRELFESEFFGHDKGAFTGALRNRAGRFELADGGTLFLDEVGEIPLELQSKLLRVLQEGQFERVGSERTQTTDVRIIAATNRDLAKDVSHGRFREDLYFRLNVFPVASVPLRDRPEDIPLLAAHFLRGACRRFARDEMRLSAADAARLQAYDWPGNVRELENAIERAVIISRNGQLRLDLPHSQLARSSTPSSGLRPATHLMTEHERKQRDRAMIVDALKACGGKVSGPGGAAELLGLKPTTLASRIKRWGIAVED
ncbi:MAG: sigma 54-interacting transcriptional regulator [Chromatiaceae bacterium]|nr:sigma 54-interacting transcriptional regulator [Gammaproteobacteria bacterium]MCP5300911.1 sigma 54-interacting transcriptional regulator [Chromatiaceae bacterium]MCP5421616.1 sigma 54-interacting transcriptional regulator [Chromatiaceae bacterium]